MSHIKDRTQVIESITPILQFEGLSDSVADLIERVGFDGLTIENLTQCKSDFNGKGKFLSEPAATRLLNAVKLAEVINSELPGVRVLTTVDKFKSEKSEEDILRIIDQVVGLRLANDNKPPMSWSNIRKEVGLSEPVFHKFIRHSVQYSEAIHLKLQQLIEEGFTYSGKVNVLCGIEVNQELVEKLRPKKLTGKTANAAKKTT